jgi:serpin B
VSPADVEALVEGNMAFGFDLYRLLADQHGDDNLFYSPHSLSLALAMTYAGARGVTEEEMAEALRFVLPQDSLHNAFNGLDRMLEGRGEGAASQDGEGFRLNIANAIWGQQGYEFQSAYLDVLAADYGAGLRVLDFATAPEASRVTINDWVSQETEGKIEDLIPQGGIDPLTRLVLTNAIYFNAAWAVPFREEATQDGPFTRLDGSQTTVPFMHQTESMGYAAGDGYQVVELPYDGGEMSMIILVPDREAFSSFEAELDGDRVRQIIEDVEYRDVELTMPRFEFESEFGLGEALTALGMETAFSGDADFSGMTGNRDLFISEVVHKAFVSVDEAGTEAAAATAVVMKMSAMQPQPVQVALDRPFIFLIRDIETGAVLFVGRVLDPTA